MSKDQDLPAALDLPAAAARIRELHQPMEQGGWEPGSTETVCSHCLIPVGGYDIDRAPWPCATMQALGWENRGLGQPS